MSEEIDIKVARLEEQARANKETREANDAKLDTRLSKVEGYIRKVAWAAWGVILMIIQSAYEIIMEKLP